MPCMYTYELVPKQDVWSLKGYNYFYWMSGSQFQWALDKFPEIKSAYHFCGTGQTYKTIGQALGNKTHVFQFYSYSLWKDWILEKVKEGES